MPDGTTLLERACRGSRGARVPVWVMRQAGRYLPEYRKIREEVDFQTATNTPELAARITLQPMQRFPLDAAIIFSDIMTPLEGMGVSLDFAPGPVLHDPIRTSAQASALRELDPQTHVPFVMDTVRIVRSELDRDRAVVGFAGAPFTLFCYLVEGSGSKDFMHARRFLREERAAVDLLDLLGASMARYLVAQLRAGADVVMLFDSWVGLLGLEDYRRMILPVMRRLIAEVKGEVDRPVIYFAPGGTALLEATAEVGADVLGIDWRQQLSTVVDRLGAGAVVQGNLDPSWLFAPRAELGAAVDRVLEEGAGAAAHVFNLGHGIHRTTDPDQVAFMVDRVREVSERSSSGSASASPR